jgi:hypothetical protein
MFYPSELIGQVVDILVSVDFRYTPLEVIETELQYPGLWHDIDQELWQRDLIKEQLKGQSTDDNGQNA